MTERVHDKGLSTQIDRRNRDAKGNKLSPERRSQAYRLRKWHKRTKVSKGKDRSLARVAIPEIDRMSSQLGLPKKVQESAVKIYKEGADKNLLRGRTIEGVASAALYAACRELKIPRTFKEIEGASPVEENEITRYFRTFCQELGLDYSPVSPVEHVSRFGSKLDLPGETQSKSIEIIREAEEAEENLTSGKSPSGTAAAAIYIASNLDGERKSQKEVAEAAGVTEVTVRNRYKELKEGLGLDLESFGGRRKKPGTGKKDPEELKSIPEYVMEFGRRLGFGTEAKSKARELMENVDLDEFSEKDPRGVAAAIDYIVDGGEGGGSAQEYLAEISGMSGPTVGQNYRALKVHVDPEDYII